MAQNSAPLLLHLERELAAPRELVFRMQTEPELVARWWGPNGFSVPRVDLDLRVGGRYRITMQPPAGEPFFLTGEFREIDSPNHLSYTFNWEPPDADDRETLVDVALRDSGPMTLMVVDQGSFATDARRELHVQGWTETLDRLAAVLAEAGDI